MGDRGQVKIGSVLLYSHWNGTELKANVKKALAKRWRWDDAEYLTRIIFDVMTQNQRDEETGFGIGTTLHTDLNNPLIEVYVEKQTVKINKIEKTFEEFIKEEVEL